MVSSQPNAPGSLPPWRSAREYALVHWALLAVVQAGNFFAHEPHAGLVALLALWPRMQMQNAVAAVAVGGLAFFAVRRTWSRWAFFVGYAVLTLLVVLDRAYYRVFSDHPRPSLGEGVRTLDPALALDSMRQAMDGWLFAILAASVAALVWLALPRRRSSSSHVFSTRSFMAVAGVLVLSSAISRVPDRYAPLAQHPLFPALQELALPHLNLGKANRTAQAPGPVDAKPSSDTQLASAARTMREKLPQPNVLLIVLESVGAVQLLGPDGLPDPAATPRLAQLCEHAVVFPEVYSVFPGTVRTHVALNTGGRQLTTSSVYEMLEHAYTGPMLARSFAEGGYRTALFSSERLDGEAMDAFVQRAHYETVYDFAQDTPSHMASKILSSWGAKEEHTRGLMERWIDETAATGRPWLLQYMTVATHHPYATPHSYPKPFPADTDQGRYRNALHYTDDAIGKLLDALAQRGLLEKTVVAITGDHGEAFGDLHPRNYTHKNFIFEENIRSFLILSHPAVQQRIVSRRVGSSGDLFPTLAAVAGLPRPDVPGLDLLAGDWPARSAIFYKTAIPEQWGLRDGRWKFIENLRDGKAQLYDLTSDPTEQHDVAAQHAALLPRFSAQCSHWFLASEDEYAKRLEGFHYRGGRAMTLDEMRTPGPKVVAFGYPDDTTGVFAEKLVLDPARAPTAWASWVAYEKITPVEFAWIAPSGARHISTLEVQPDWTTTRIEYPGPLPMETGEWTVTLSEAGRELLRGRFAVRVGQQ